MRTIASLFISGRTSRRRSRCGIPENFDHRGLVIGDSIGALAHLQLGRAYALLGDKTKAKSAYQDFLALSRDADPDVPILKEAKAEYAKLM